MTASSLALPSVDDAAKALKYQKDACDDTEWRDVVLKCLEYATDPTSVPDAAANDDRVNETVLFLLEAINTFSHNDNPKDSAESMDVDVDAGTRSSNADGIIDSSDSRGNAEGVVVDALWLMGTMLEPQKEASASDTTDDGKLDCNIQNATKSYDALCKLVYALGNGVKPSTEDTPEGAAREGQESRLKPIPFRTMLTSLEPSLLKTSKLLSDKSIDLFLKKTRKLNTDMYYRQKKVNLMQEESEGYAKLIRFLVDLPSSCAPSEIKAENDTIGNETDAGDNGDCGNATSIKTQMDMRDMHDQFIQQTKLRMTELIGSFDLDPNRCLDLTLDVLETQIQEGVVKKMNTTGANGSTPKTASAMRDLVRNAPANAMTVHMLLHIIQLFPIENVTHLIGFKYHAYHNHTTATAVKETPLSLYITTGILASHSLLFLPALQPHLPPLSDIKHGYDRYSIEYKTKIKKAGVVSLNSSNKKNDNNVNEEHEKKKLREKEALQNHQSLQLFCTLLNMDVGWDLATSIFKLEKGSSDGGDALNQILVQCCCIYPSLGQILCDQVLTAISALNKTKANEVGKVLSDMSERKMSEEGETKAEIEVGEYSLLPAGFTKIRGLDFKSDSTLTALCENLSRIMEPIIMSGCIVSNPVLYTKLCELIRAMLSEEREKKDGGSDEAQIAKIDDQVLAFLERFLVSSLSLFAFDPAMASNLWSVLCLLPFQLRYALYSSWRKHGLEKAALRSMIQPPKPLAQIESEVTTAIKTRYLLKRLSKDNVKAMGRQLSDVAHNNPLVVFTLMLNQIESYDNLIIMMVEAFKFMGVLSLDVLSYCLLVSLGGEGEGRNKLKDDGVNTAQWFSSLETFAGAFYKKFTEVELHGLLAYFAKRLHGGHALELGVLQSLVKMAGGYGFVDSCSPAALSTMQLDGRCGSLTLKRETSDFGIVEKMNIKSSRRLRAALQSNDCGVTFLILLSQLRRKILFGESKESPKQIKLIGNLYDNCHRTLITLLAFLTDGSQDVRDSSSSTNDGAIAIFAKTLPTLGDLCGKFGLQTADAWSLCRPLIRAALFAEEDLGKKTPDIPEYLRPFHPTSEKMKCEYHDLMPEQSRNQITPVLFQRFYSYAIYDMICPDSTYKSEIARIRKEIDRLDMLQRGGSGARGIHASMAQAAAAAGGTQRAVRQATAFTKEHEQDLERYRHSIRLLTIDHERQQKHIEHVRKVLNTEKTRFFGGLNGETSKVEAMGTFFTTCVFPRSLLSPEDAMYCAQFITFLHRIETPGFCTMDLFDVIVSAVVGALYSMTEDEAACLGIFLNILWKLISEWRYDKKSFERQVDGKPGGVWRKNRNDQNSMNDNDVDHSISHSDYVELYNQWHASLGVAFIGCLRSTEYMHTRAALVVLSGMNDHFPTKSTLGEKLLKALVPLQKDDNPMQDIRAMAQAYSSKIIKARDTGSWKEEDRKSLKAREEREKKQKEDRKKNSEKRFAEMKKDTEQLDRQLGDGYNDRKPHDRRGPPPTLPASRFTAPPGGNNGSGNSSDPAVAQSHGDRPSRRQDHRGHRDDRPQGRVLRRDEIRNNENSDLQSRWERNTGPADSNRGAKRTRSPENNRGAMERGGRGDWDRDRERDVKRSRREASPPRRRRPKR